MVDTGSNYSFVTDALCRRPGLTPKPAVADDGTRIELAGAPADGVTVRMLRAGDLYYSNSDLLVVAGVRLSKLVGPGIDGAIGANALQSFPFMLDWTARMMTVWAKGPLSADERANAGMADALEIPLLAPADGEPRYSVPVKLNDCVTDDLLLDTGAGVTTISQEAASKLQLKPSRTDKAFPSFEAKMPLHFATLQTFRIGRMALLDFELGYGERQGPGAGQGVLGQTVLSRFRMLVDMPAKKLYLKPIAAEKP